MRFFRCGGLAPPAAAAPWDQPPRCLRSSRPALRSPILSPMCFAMSVFFHEEDLPQGVLADGAVAVDTEAMGLHPGRDRLCLVQISDGRGAEPPVPPPPARGHAA